MSRQITNSDLQKDMAVLKSEVTSGHDALRQQFNAGYDMILEKLKPLEDLKREMADTKIIVARQGKSIAWMRGVGTALYVILGSGAAYLGLVRHK